MLRRVRHRSALRALPRSEDVKDPPVDLTAAAADDDRPTGPGAARRAPQRLTDLRAKARRVALPRLPSAQRPGHAAVTPAEDADAVLPRDRRGHRPADPRRDSARRRARRVPRWPVRLRCPAAARVRPPEPGRRGVLRGVRRPDGGGSGPARPALSPAPQAAPAAPGRRCASAGADARHARARGRAGVDARPHRRRASRVSSSSTASTAIGRGAVAGGRSAPGPRRTPSWAVCSGP